MPHDPVRVAETSAWLGRAQSDLRAADVDLAAKPALLDDAVFHCQQAAEKAAKAFLEALIALATARALVSAVIARLPREVSR